MRGRESRFRIERMHIAVPHIVRQDHDNVRQLGRAAQTRGKDCQQRPGQRQDNPNKPLRPPATRRNCVVRDLHDSVHLALSFQETGIAQPGRITRRHPFWPRFQGASIAARVMTFPGDTYPQDLYPMHSRRGLHRRQRYLVHNATSSTTTRRRSTTALTPAGLSWSDCHSAPPHLTATGFQRMANRSVAPLTNSQVLPAWLEPAMVRIVSPGNTTLAV